MSENQYMSKETRRPGAPVGNQNAAKLPENRITGKGRINADFGALKSECVRAASARKMKLVPWLREAAREKIERESS